MARIRWRVHATRRRALHGSDFQKCTKCETLVPIAPEDMHKCDTQVKSNQRFQHQPKSAFRFFMDNFAAKRCEGNNDNQIEDDLEGFNKWREMPDRSKLRFELEAERVNIAYTKALLWEAETMSTLVNDDEVDSAEVGKYEKIP